MENSSLVSECLEVHCMQTLNKFVRPFLFLLFFSLFFPFSLPDGSRTAIGNSFFRNPPPPLLFFSLSLPSFSFTCSFFSLSVSLSLCCRSAAIPSTSHSCILHHHYRSWRRKTEEEAVLFFQIVMILPCFCCSSFSRLFKCPFDRFFFSPRCPSLTFQIGLGLRHSVVYGSERSPLGLYTSHSFTHTLCSWVRVLLMYTDTLSIAR